MNIKQSSFFILLVGFLAFGQSLVNAQKIYWTDVASDTIKRSNLDGTDVVDIVVPQLLFPLGLSLDTSTGKMYWTDTRHGEIRRSNLDGSEIQDVVTTGYPSPLFLDIDKKAAKIYWTRVEGDFENGKIQRSNLNGSGVEDIVIFDGLSGPGKIALDIDAGMIYWIDNYTTTIHRAKLDGSNMETIVQGDWYTIAGIALDLSASKLYWTGWIDHSIHRADLDGSNVEEVFSDRAYWPKRIIVSAETGMIYWTNQSDILRVKLDGSNVEHLTTVNPHEVGELAMDTHCGKLYWTVMGPDSGNGMAKVQRANLDGSNVEDLIIKAAFDPTAITLDRAKRKIYWTNGNADWIAPGRIHRASLDGAELESLDIGNDGLPRGIALDVGAGKMYWADGSHGEIRRANITGSNEEAIVTTGGMSSIALDTGAGKIYWTDPHNYQIKRADFDGSNIEVLIPRDVSLLSAAGLALDLIHGRMYWISGGVIRYADLDGSNMAIAIVVSGHIRGIAIDPISQKIFWTAWEYNPFVARIQCANLDGSNIQDIVTVDIGKPLGIALDLCGREELVGPADYLTLVDCLAGPVVVATGDCYCADISGDAHVDMIDFSILQRTFHEP